MLTEIQRQRFSALQQSETDGILSPAEQAEMQAFVQQIEAEEAAYLRPATERILQERLRIEEQNKALQDVIRRKERLARRLERILELSAAESEKINAQVAAVLNINTTGQGMQARKKVLDSNKICVLCGKDRSQIKRLILGIHGGVCPECVYRCLQILQAEAEPASAPGATSKETTYPTHATATE